jgi:DNA-binding MarR family transcriptional regulator
VPDTVRLPYVVPKLSSPTPHTDPVSISGSREASQKRGYRFTRMNTYLRRHPVLSQTEREVLDVLVEYAVEYADLDGGGKALLQRRVSPTLIADELLMSRGTIERALSNLETFGLVETKPDPKDRRRYRYWLCSGPWPKLGDYPEKMLAWKDQPRGRQMAREWRDLVLSGAAEANTLEVLVDFLMRHGVFMMTTVPVLRGFRDDGGDAEVYLDRPKSKKHDASDGDRPDEVYGASDGYLPEAEEEPSTSRKPENTLLHGEILDRPRARAVGTSKKEEGRLEQSALPPVAGAPQVAPSGGGSRLSEVVAGARAWTPQRDRNPVSVVLTAYRVAVNGQFGVELPPSRKKDRAEVKRSIDNFGVESVLDTIDWVFDNWAHYQRVFKLAHSYPPRFLFTGQGWMEHLTVQAQRKELPGPKKALNWNQHTNEQYQERDDHLQDDLFALLGDDT